ncbi:MAG: hypothetical protein DME21_10350 [Verrucomicrobia bacterium]|nr:MAG: hypothetical protein DME21_10350 [Verrucomicrobiota bacterium]
MSNVKKLWSQTKAVFGTKCAEGAFPLPLKIMIAVRGRSAILLSLFVPAGSIQPAWKGGTASKSSPGSSEPGGQNNIDINPVIRGMVRRRVPMG